MSGRNEWFSTREEGGFVASPGWSELFAAADAAIKDHQAAAEHAVVVSVKSKGAICFSTDVCCSALGDRLDQIEAASMRTCQACGAPGSSSGYLIECDAHRGQWPYGTAD